MSLFSREKAQKLRERVIDKESERGYRRRTTTVDYDNFINTMEIAGAL